MKYGNTKTEVDGIVFDSKAEANRYKELRALEIGGEVQGRGKATAGAEGLCEKGDAEEMRETPEDLKTLGITYRRTDYRALMKEAERLALELDDARNATPKSPQMTGMPHSGSQTTLDLQMEIIEAAEKRFYAARDRALARLSEIEDKIDSLEDPQLRRVLYFRHVYRLNWYEVAEKMHYSKSSVQRFHRQALKELERSEDE